jgi:IclR family KDG regulon transcriptional repressor
VRHLNTIKELKYAVNDEEMEVGVKCISAPILDYTRHVVGALTISGPSVRMAEKRMNNELIPLVKKAAEEISARLGY